MNIFSSFQARQLTIRALGGAARRVRRACRRAVDQRRAATACEAVELSMGRLPLLFNNSPVVDQFLDHRFDLLGSGWTRVEYGMKCRGIAGVHAHDPATSISSVGHAIRDGLRPAHQERAEQLLKLIDPPYSPIDWQLDFKSGYRWSAKQWYADVRWGGATGADIKVPWELSRFQHLPQLALSLGVSRGRDQRIVREIRNQILDFLAFNPVRMGVNWRSSMDVAIRISNWLVALDILSAKGMRYEDEFRREVSRAVREHARHIVDNLEWDHGRPANHYLANLTGLIFAASYLPPDCEAEAWLAFGRQELLTEVARQFSDDGSNFEGSTCYHALATELVVYATALLVGLPQERQESLFKEHAWPSFGQPRLRSATHRQPGESGELFPAWFVERINKMLEFGSDLTHPDGQFVQFGDNDSGHLLKLAPQFVETTTTAAKATFANLDTFDDPPEGRYWLEDNLRKTSIWAAAQSLLGHSPTPQGVAAEVVRGLARNRTLQFRPSGHGLQRATDGVRPPLDARACNGNRADDDCELRTLARWKIDYPSGRLLDGIRMVEYPGMGVVAIRSAELYLAVCYRRIHTEATGGHVHDDCMTMELSLGGRPVWVDPGSYVYSPLPAKRNEYRSAAAHFSLSGWLPSAVTDHASIFRFQPRWSSRLLHCDARRVLGELRCGETVLRREIRIDDARLTLMDLGSHETDCELTMNTVPISPGYGVIERDVQPVPWKRLTAA